MGKVTYIMINSTERFIRFSNFHRSANETKRIESSQIVSDSSSIHLEVFELKLTHIENSRLDFS